ncbi:MAG: SRPBCC family protein [Rubrobacter sp.]|nr:SRPBCC family protein [Rubrobacter sp.]
MSPGQETTAEDAGGSLGIERRIEAPAAAVASYISDFRNAKEWMVSVENVEHLGGEDYRFRVDSPIGKLEPEVRVTERREDSTSWVYTSKIEGSGRVDVTPAGDEGCTVAYSGEFRLKGRLANRAARMVGLERFARKNGERSLSRLKSLLEARRY